MVITKEEKSYLLTKFYLKFLELKKIAETIKDSKKNNISYNQIESDIQKYVLCFVCFFVFYFKFNLIFSSSSTYINKVLNKYQQHKCFHLIKTNSQYLQNTKRKEGSSLQSKYCTLRENGRKIVNNNDASSFYASSSNILSLEGGEEANQNQRSNSTRTKHSSFLKKHENEFKLRKQLSQQYLNKKEDNQSNMIETDNRQNSKRTSSSAINLNQFEQQNIMQKTYRKNSKNENTKLKLININKMFKKCQQQMQQQQQQQQQQSQPSTELETTVCSSPIVDELIIKPNE